MSSRSGNDSAAAVNKLNLQERKVNFVDVKLAEGKPDSRGIKGNTQRKIPISAFVISTTKAALFT